jgi:predicted O-methyltransferase YrrM
MNEYQFTNDWFDTIAKKVWDKVVPLIKPTKILEVGSYEGASACYLIEKCGAETDLEIHCVDTWSGGLVRLVSEEDERAIEARFKHNIKLATEASPNKINVVVHRGLSDNCLSRLLSENKKDYFDFIYIDGSHEASEVLCDAVLGFKLLRIGGIMAFDDYLWTKEFPYGKDILRCPKPAIDAFINLNIRKLQILSAPLYQIYIQKTAD